MEGRGQLYIAVYLPIYLPTYLPTYLSAYLPACLPACLPTCLPTCLSVCLSTCLSAYPKPQGVPKFEKRLQCVDRETRDLSNGVKIVKLRSRNPQIFQF